MYDVGDAESDRITKTQRASKSLFNTVSKEFTKPIEEAKGDSKVEEAEKSELKVKAMAPSVIDNWVDSLSEDATYNFESYAECFISENLIRRFIAEEKIELSEEAKRDISEWKVKETNNKKKGNISIDIRRNPYDLSYLSMDSLANLVDKKDKVTDASLSRDACEYKPIRDALMHTATLTDDAKKRIAMTRTNIKSRVKTLISASKDPQT